MTPNRYPCLLRMASRSAIAIACIAGPALTRLVVMASDSALVREGRPTLCTNCKTGAGINDALA